MRLQLRPAVVADIPAVLALWREAAAPTSTDTESALRGLIERDPGALIVAEAGHEVVGSVIAGWDGWRGAVYRLAVAPACRRRGLGADLLRAAEDRLAALGARRLHAIVVAGDPRAVGFWDASDWVKQSEQVRYAKGG
jgi:ribosomal protein S18 acetylase RimI-like enzyme